MGLGSTAKKVQKLADVGEKTYKRLNDMREQMQDLRTTVEDTGDRVETLEQKVTEQRAILDELAREYDIDPEAVVREETITATADDSVSDQATTDDERE